MTSCIGEGGTGTLYTYSQLEGLWINAGGPKAVAPVAAAIALAESNGCTAALNPIDNGGAQTSVGLWQVSNGTHQYPQSWTTAAGNATEAVAKYQGAGNSFSPWGTYKSGAYTAYLNGNTPADTNVPGGGSAGGSATLTSATTAGCLIGGTSVDLKVTSVSLPCLLYKSNLRGLVGAVVLGVSVSVGLVGAVILAASAFNHTGAGKAVQQTVALVPGVGAGAAAARRAAPRTAPRPARQRPQAAQQST